jgi:cytochrome c
LAKRSNATARGRVFLIASLFGLTAFGLLAPAANAADNVDDMLEAVTTTSQSARPAWLLPMTDPARGRRLFVGKGCVLCHSIQGVGGRMATALDAKPSDAAIDPFDFMARMWRGATPMLALQSFELGYQIDMSGDELVDIMSFVSNAKAQTDFTIDDVPEVMRESFIDEPFAPFDGPLPDDD